MNNKQELILALSSVYIIASLCVSSLICLVNKKEFWESILMGLIITSVLTLFVIWLMWVINCIDR